MSSIRQYGAEDGVTCIYLHGAPGGPEEAAWLDAAAASHGVRLLAPARWSVAPNVDDARYFAALADEIARLMADGPAHLMGFSLGASAALEVARLLPRPPAGLHLVSPAAPLRPGDLETMAGGPVFRMAQRSRGLLDGVTRLQHLALRLAPRLVLEGLFASASGEEARLAKDPEFRRVLLDLLRRSYGADRRGYVRDVVLYVGQADDDILPPPAPLRLWHGADDTWAPPAMTQRLANGGGGLARSEVLPGLAHYTCLFAAAPRIFDEIGRQPAAA